MSDSVLKPADPSGLSRSLSSLRSAARLLRPTATQRPLVLALLIALAASAAQPLLTAVSLAQNAAVAQDGDAAAPADAPADPAPTTTAPAAEKTTFLEMMAENSGVFGIILLLLSFAMVYIIAKNVADTRRSELLPDDFVEEFEGRLEAKDYKGAFELSQQYDSMISRVLEAGMSRLKGGHEQAVAAMEEVGEAETMALEHKLSYLALIGSIAPMIGLMGTVYGMIDSFSTIANSETAPKPKELASGISQALFTTIEGLAVAVPAMIAYTILRNRMSETVLEVGAEAETLMSRFNQVGGSKKPAAKAEA